MVMYKAHRLDKDVDKSLDLFAGVGGFRLGMEEAGIETVGWVECDPHCGRCKKITTHQPSPDKENHSVCMVCGTVKKQYARESYQAMHDTEGEWTGYDITQITDDDIRLLRGFGITVISGGFPCQSFSVAGKRGGMEDTRGTLFFEIARIAKEIKPRILFLENVKGLLSHDNGRTFGIILNTLDELGYDVEWQSCNSKDFGVPQNRERVFIVGHLRGRGGRKVFPINGTDEQTSLEINILAHRNGFRRNTQVFDPKGLTETLDTGQGGGRGHYTVVEQKAEITPVASPFSQHKVQNGRRFKTAGEPMFTLNTMDRHGVLINHGKLSKIESGNSTCLDANYSKGMDNHGQRTGILTENQRIRKLTPKECFRLQGFPDELFNKAQKVNSDSQLYKQAGNSVTVNVIYAIAKRFTMGQ